jgi:hypothetical protein
MIHYHVLADVAAEHRNALVAEGTAHRLAKQARHASRPRESGTAPQHSAPRDVVVVAARCAGAATRT